MTDKEEEWYLFWKALAWLGMVMMMFCIFVVFILGAGIDRINLFPLKTYEMKCYLTNIGQRLDKLGDVEQRLDKLESKRWYGE